MLKPEELGPGIASKQELELAYEELAVAGEELRVQNEELVVAHQALEEERRRYQELFDLAPDAYLETDLRGVVLRANQAAVGLLGAGPASLLGIRLQERVPEADMRHMLAHMAEFQAGSAEQPRRWEMRLTSRLGRTFDAAMTASFIGPRGQDRATLAWLIRDVSERKEAERALQAALAEAEEGRRTLDALMEYLPEGITIAQGQDMKLTRVSRHGQQVLGERHAGMTVAEVLAQWAVYEADGLTPVGPEDTPLARAIVNGEVVEGRELVQVTAGGERVWLSCNAGPIRNAAGEISGGVVAWRDVTDQRRVQEAVQRLAEFPAENPDPVLRFAPDGRLLFANPPGQKWLESMERGEGRALPQTALRDLVSKACRREGVMRVEMKSDAGRTFSLAVTCPTGQTHVNIHVRDITERIRIEDALRASEAKLQALFEVLPVGISILDSQRQIRYSNPALSRILDLPANGLARGEYRQRTYIHPGGSPVAAHEFASARAFSEQQPVHDVEIGVGKEDGSLVWTNVSAVPLPFADWSLILVTADITEKVRTRQRIEEQAALLDTMLASIADAVVFYGLDGRILRTNAAADAMFGYGRGDPILPLAERIAHTRPRREDGSLFALEELPVMHALRGETVTGVIMASDLHPGPPTWISVSAAPVCGSDGKLLGAIVTFTDITELRRAREELEERVQERTGDLLAMNELLQEEIAARRLREAELRESELRFRQLAENIQEVFWLAEPKEERLVYVSPGFEAVWGRPVMDAHEHSQQVLQDVHPQDRDALIDLWLGRSNEEQEFRIIRADGGIRWLRGRAFPVEGEPGAARRIAGVLSDVTAQKEAEMALVFAERLSTAGRMAASLSHEINNPLQSAIGCVDLAREDLEAGRDPSQYLVVVSEALARAARVVARLRAMNREWREEELRPSDLKEAVDRVLLLTQKSCELKGVSVIREVDEGLPTVQLMNDGIQQVFLNLVLNALDAMPVGGTLRVSVEASEPSGGVVVRIADTGVGIPVEDLQHLFEPFRSTKTDGLGLGLFICHNIVAQHGGRLEIDSEEGKGTEVRVWLPA